MSTEIDIKKLRDILNNDDRFFSENIEDEYIKLMGIKEFTDFVQAENLSLEDIIMRCIYRRVEHYDVFNNLIDVDFDDNIQAKKIYTYIKNFQPGITDSKDRPELTNNSVTSIILSALNKEECKLFYSLYEYDFTYDNFDEYLIYLCPIEKRLDFLTEFSVEFKHFIGNYNDFKIINIFKPEHQQSAFYMLRETENMLPEGIDYRKVCRLEFLSDKLKDHILNHFVNDED